MSTGNEFESLVEAVVNRISQQNAERKTESEAAERTEKEKWGDPNYLKTLSTDEINNNWDKIQAGLKK